MSGAFPRGDHLDTCVDRDVSENRSIALLKFRAREDAEEFAQVYNGREFNSMEVGFRCPLFTTFH